MREGQIADRRERATLQNDQPAIKKYPPPTPSRPKNTHIPSTANNRPRQMAGPHTGRTVGTYALKMSRSIETWPTVSSLCGCRSTEGLTLRPTDAMPVGRYSTNQSDTTIAKQTPPKQPPKQQTYQKTKRHERPYIAPFGVSPLPQITLKSINRNEPMSQSVYRAESRCKAVFGASWGLGCQLPLASGKHGHAAAEHITQVCGGLGWRNIAKDGQK